MNHLSKVIRDDSQPNVHGGSDPKPTGVNRNLHTDISGQWSRPGELMGWPMSVNKSGTRACVLTGHCTHMVVVHRSTPDFVTLNFQVRLLILVGWEAMEELGVMLN